MDRSATPKASQQPHRRAQSPSYTTPPAAASSRRPKNRSRSGSEELSQIIAQAQANAARFGVTTNAAGFWPLDEAITRPDTVTPTTYNKNGSSEPHRTTSPGLLGWVRNAFVLGPSGRNGNASSDADQDSSVQHRPYGADDPIRRNETPLLPGILPSFHHIELSHSRDGGKSSFTPISERTSLSFDDDESRSVGHESIEAYDRWSRRASSMSTDSSATVYDEDDDDGENGSDTEVPYAPFAQRQQGPSIIRPTARREPLQLEDDSPPTSRFQRPLSTISNDARRQSSMSEHALTVSEAQDSTQFVSDTGVDDRTIPSVVISTDPYGLRAQEEEGPHVSPIAGWVDMALPGPSSATPKPPAPKTDAADDTNDPRSSTSMRITNDSENTVSSNFQTAEDQLAYSSESRRGSLADSTDSHLGDGEDLNDTLGRPKSPEELMRNRQSRENVVLGSRGANARAGTDVSARRGARNVTFTPAKSIVGVIGQSSSAVVPTTAILEASEEKKAFDKPLKATSPATAPMELAPEQEPKTPAAEPAASVGGLVSPVAVRSRGPLSFLSRRKTTTGGTSTPPSRHPRVASLDDDQTSSLMASNSPSPFWKLGKRQSAHASSPSPRPAVSASKDGSAQADVEDAAVGRSKPSRTSSSEAQGANPSVCNPCRLTHQHDSLTHAKSGHGALGASMKPRKIKVRGRNKPSKEREFSHMYLAQEIFLTSSSADGGASPSSPLASPKLGAQMKLGKTTMSAIGADQQANPNVAPATADSSITPSTSIHSTSTTNTTQGKRKATWAMKFSLDGHYLAVAGQDAVIRVFAVLGSPDARHQAIEEVVQEDGEDRQHKFAQSSAALSTSSHQSNSNSGRGSDDVTKAKARSKADMCKKGRSESDAPHLFVFSHKPIREFKGHTSDILDLSWSKGGFLLSASMDNTARVWHLSKPNSLVAFKHADFVTCAVFHPRDDRFFLSGSLDGKLRLWNISSKRVQASQDIPGLITACAFSHSGAMACVGTFSGAALFYHTDGLTFASSFAVRSATGKHQKGGRKITAIEPILPDPNQATIANSTTEGGKRASSERVLITSNDSRVRAYDLGTKKIIARFKAKTYNNRSSQIRATLSDDDAYVVAGSEAHSGGDGGQVHIWECGSIFFESSARSLLGKIAIGGMQAMAVANQRTTGLLRSGSRSRKSSMASQDANSVDFQHVNPAKKRNAAVTSDSVVEYFTAHAGTVTCAIMAPIQTSGHLQKANDPIMVRSEAKLHERIKEGGPLLDAITGLSTNISRTIVSIVQNPLRVPSLNGGGADKDSREADVKSESSHSSVEAEMLQLSSKLNRIIVSVDDNAVVRVWRTDRLETMANT